MPGFEPWLDWTITLSPNFNSCDCEAKLVVDVFNEGSGLGRLLMLLVGDTVLFREAPFVGGNRMSKPVSDIVASANGQVVKRVNRENTPFFGSH